MKIGIRVLARTGIEQEDRKRMRDLVACYEDPQGKDRLLIIARLGNDVVVIQFPRRRFNVPDGIAVGVQDS